MWRSTLKINCFFSSPQLATVKNVLIDEMPVPSAYAGDHASLVLNGLEQYNVSNGMVACDPSQPIAVTKRIKPGLSSSTSICPSPRDTRSCFTTGAFR